MEEELVDKCQLPEFLQANTEEAAASASGPVAAAAAAGCARLGETHMYLFLSCSYSLQECKRNTAISAADSCCCSSPEERREGTPSTSSGRPCLHRLKALD